MNQLDAYRLLQARARRCRLSKRFCVDCDYCRKQVKIIDRRTKRWETLLQ